MSIKSYQNAIKNPKQKSAICAQCKQPFTFTHLFGTGPKLCSDFCRRNKRHANAKAQPLCIVEGCSNPRGYKCGICNSCYYRQRRTGTLERHQTNYRSINSNGYVLVGGDAGKNHPLANSNGLVFEHRKVLFDHIGAGPHRCHWCSAPIEWKAGICTKGSLVPDHLDGNKANNSIANLVPACNRCNSARGLFMSWVLTHRDDPWFAEYLAMAVAKRQIRCEGEGGFNLQT